MDVAVFTWRVAPVLGTCEIEIARVDRWGSHTSNFTMVYSGLLCFIILITMVNGVLFGIILITMVNSNNYGLSYL